MCVIVLTSGTLNLRLLLWLLLRLWLLWYLLLWYLLLLRLRALIILILLVNFFVHCVCDVLKWEKLRTLLRV